MKSKSIELLEFDKNHKLEYRGKCKLQINRLSSMLLVEPENEEYKLISAMFKWNFTMDKNILFIFAEHELSDFALIFNNEIRCKKVYDFICKEKDKHDVGKEMLYQRFLLSLCEMVKGYTTLNLKKIIAKWIDSHKSEEKEELIKVLKENDVYDIIFLPHEGRQVSVAAEIAVESLNVNGSNENSREKACISRKRRRPGINNVRQSSDNRNNNSRKRKTLSKSYSTNISDEQFKLVNVKSNIQLLRRLLIFTNPEQTQCYEYR